MGNHDHWACSLKVFGVQPIPCVWELPNAHPLHLRAIARDESNVNQKLLWEFLSLRWSLFKRKRLQNCRLKRLQVRSQWRVRRWRLCVWRRGGLTRSSELHTCRFLYNRTPTRKTSSAAQMTHMTHLTHLLPASSSSLCSDCVSHSRRLVRRCLCSVKFCSHVPVFTF